jgi:hypothetical protein
VSGRNYDAATASAVGELLREAMSPLGIGAS